MSTIVEQNPDILRPLTDTEVEELLLLYREKYGNNNFHYLLLYNQCKWNWKLREIETSGLKFTEEQDRYLGFRKQFYTHRNCDFRKNGTYISLHRDIMQSVSFNSWEADLKELYECLNETQLIEWTKGPLLTNVDLQYCAPVKLIAQRKGTSVQRARTCFGLILNHDDALKTTHNDLPVDYELRPLEIKHAELIHSLWPNSKEGSLAYVRGLIELNKNLGIYRKSDDKLVAWIFQNDFSGLGILQVLPEVQRMGFGSILVMALSKQIAQTEQVQISAWIVIENNKSEALLTKIGFQKSVINEWIQLNKID